MRTRADVRTISDRELWARGAAGDAEAFGVLFERHGDAISGYLFRRAADWALAEELTSVVFLEAWRHRAVTLERESALPWLYGTATNVLRNQRRSLRRHRAALARLPRPRSEPDFAEEASERASDASTLRQLLPVLERLPGRYREVFSLCVLAELSYEEAAAALGIPVGTVRSRLSRARARMAELAAASGHELGESLQTHGGSGEAMTAKLTLPPRRPLTEEQRRRLKQHLLTEYRLTLERRAGRRPRKRVLVVTEGERC
jgi:RNA polymerase sigma factor (sigma-70 family)